MMRIPAKFGGDFLLAAVGLTALKFHEFLPSANTSACYCLYLNSSKYCSDFKLVEKFLHILYNNKMRFMRFRLF